MRVIIFLIFLSSSFVLNAKTFEFLPGSTQQTQFKPERFKEGFHYDILYYIPQKLRFSTMAKTLVFLHGGGASTMTREGSLQVAKSYMKDLVDLAEKLGFILVAPSGSGLNWNTHTRTFLRDLNSEIIKDLKVDPDKIALSGHSMGGMGITRSALWLADQYAFFLPMAAGMQENYREEMLLLPYLNFSYHHIQGLYDHFREFITRCQEQEKAVKLIEQKYGQPADFVMEFTQDAHNYNKALLEKRLAQLFSSKKVNRYQKVLYPIFLNRDEHSIYNNIEWHNGPITNYFWVSALGFKTGSEGLQTHLKVNAQGNIIEIETLSTENSVAKLKLSLSDKMFDFKKNITVFFDGRIIYHGKVKSRGEVIRNELSGIGRINLLDNKVDLILKL